MVCNIFSPVESKLVLDAIQESLELKLMGNTPGNYPEETTKNHTTNKNEAPIFLKQSKNHGR